MNNSKAKAHFDEEEAILVSIDKLSSLNQPSKENTKQDLLDFWDGTDLLTKPDKPVDWLVEGFMPQFSVLDIGSPPGVGKTTLVNSLILAITNGRKSWCGKKIVNGKVVILGGEKSSEDAAARDLKRIGEALHPPRGTLLIDKNDSPIWEWNRNNYSWELTSYGQQMTEFLKVMKPILVVLDTSMAVARGSNQLDNPQQYSFGKAVMRWNREIKSTTLMVSHTNQASNTQSLEWRLDYMSRAGGNGLPGAVRWICMMSILRADDELAKKLNIEERARTEKIICVGASKYNEIAPPDWNQRHPVIFKILEDGGLLLVMDGAEVKARINSTRVVANDKKRKSKVIEQVDNLSNEESSEEESEYGDW